MKKSLLITFDYPPIRGGVSHNLWKLYQQFSKDKLIVLTKKVDKTFNSDQNIIRDDLLYQSIWPRWIKLFFITKKNNYKRKD